MNPAMSKRPDPGGGPDGTRANGPRPPAILSPVPRSWPAPRPGPPPAPPGRRRFSRRWAAAAALGLAVIGAGAAAREFWPPSPPALQPAHSAPAPGSATGTRPDLATALQGMFHAVLPEAGMSVRSVRRLPPPGGWLLATASSPAGETRFYEVAMTRSSAGWSITARRLPRPHPPAYPLAPPVAPPAAIPE